MKLGKLCVVVVLVAAILLVPVTIYSLHPRPSETSESTTLKASNLAPHERITIQDAADFTNPGAPSGCECVRGGSGSSSDPFVISDWKLSVSDDDAISIARTTMYFIIFNVSVNVTGVYNSVVLRSVANGTIRDSFFSGGGISLYNSNAISILNNTITGSKFGMLLEASNGNTISGNRLDRIQLVGIFVRSSDNLVEKNHVTDGSYGGINIDGMTGFGSDNRIVNNVVEGNPQYGVGLWVARNNTVKGNVISNNGGAGIMLVAACTKNIVEQNNVMNNKGDGILVDEQSTDNKITGNTATGNGNGTTTFDLHDESSDNLWLSNTFDTRRPDTIG
ncbi:MAG: right-handed parallel beta-helix repeat-containing protein [Candidatus Bathyarchaeia archaeon]|jgi:parallel beta-helix repeat protein